MSTGTDILCSKRNRTKADLFSNLIFIKCNAKVNAAQLNYNKLLLIGLYDIKFHFLVSFPFDHYAHQVMEKIQKFSKKHW